MYFNPPFRLTKRKEYIIYNNKKKNFLNIGRSYGIF
jgi:hypothetical protein